MLLLILLQVQTLLEEASSVAITTDSAVIKHTGDSYVTVTGHWVTKEWKLMAAVLGVYVCDSKAILFCDL